MTSPAQARAPGASSTVARAANPASFAVDEVPGFEPDAFRGAVLAALEAGARLSAFLVLPLDEGPELLAVLADDAGGELSLVRGRVAGGAFAALTPEAPQAQAFEREIFELHGLRPEGHPWLKPLRRHRELDPEAPEHPFFSMEGPGIHEVAVGPVHAGIIEPGHFRFQCRGEDVFHLEIHLGYQHRGAEALLLQSKPARRLAIAETLAGDTSVGHATAHCLAMEALAGVEAPPRADALRAVGLELERLANHAGDLGALAGDVGYLPASAYFGRLRGEFLNLSLELCGSRFGRGLLRAGGVRFDLPAEKVAPFLERLAIAARQVDETADMMLEAPSVLSRFERAGTLTREEADRYGLVGPAARACGCPRDARRDHPTGAWRGLKAEVVTAETGDVLARAQVRWREARQSVETIRKLVGELPAGPVAVDLPPPRPDRVAVAITEGWRGEIVHVALSGPDGGLRAVKVVDPSFHNWFGLAQALRGNPISDFPLCNKSFNLSYSGHDL